MTEQRARVEVDAADVVERQADGRRRPRATRVALGELQIRR